MRRKSSRVPLGNRRVLRKIELRPTPTTASLFPERTDPRSERFVPSAFCPVTVSMARTQLGDHSIFKTGGRLLLTVPPPLERLYLSAIANSTRRECWSY